MQEFLQTSFYVLLFAGIYGMAAICGLFAYFVNKSCDKWDSAHRAEKQAFLAAAETLERRDMAKKLEKRGH